MLGSSAWTQIRIWKVVSQSPSIVIGPRFQRGSRTFRFILWPTGGGCTVPFYSHSSAPLGNDCTSIPGVSDIECIRGTCVVRKCAKGWEAQPVAGNPTALECVPKSNEGAPTEAS